MTPRDLSEREIQTLILKIELSDPVETEHVNGSAYSFYPKTMEEAERYFCKFAEDLTDGERLLTRRGLLNGGSQLTAEGRAVAEELRRLRPPIYYWYRMYYEAIETSSVFAEASREIYGIDIDQFGFSGIEQIEKASELLALRPEETLLDIGCGNGKIARYIAGKSGSRCVGMDYVPEAVASADRGNQDDSVSFLLLHIDDLGTLERQFDAAMAIDTIFYARSFDSVFSAIHSLLVDTGRFVLVSGTEDGMEESLAKHFAHTRVDCTEDCFRTMKRKNHVMRRFEQRFRDESNEFIWRQYMAESLDDSATEIPDGFARFVYHCTKESPAANGGGQRETDRADVLLRKAWGKPAV